MAVKIQLRRGTQAQFNSASLDPLDGEVFLVQVNDSDDTGGYLVVGDGTRTWEQLRDDVDARVYFEPGYSQTVMGGEQPAGSTPLTVKGATSQTAAILKVTNQGDSSILEIYDDEGPTVRLEDHGDAGEVFVQLKQQASQTGNALELKASDNDTQLSISCDGEVAITPTNDQTADAPSLDVKGSGANNSGILRVKDSSNNAVLTVKSDGVESEQTVTVDGGSIIAQVEDTAASNVTITASATDSDKVVTVDGNSGTENLSITAGGAVTSEGKGTFADLEVDVTGRSVADASVLRADEIFARLEKQVSPFSFSITGTTANTDFNTASDRLLRLEGAEDDDPRKRQVFDPANVASAFQLKNVQGTSSNPETHPADANDTNPYLIKVPANSGPFSIFFCVYSNTGQLTDKMRIISYTSTDAVTGKNEIVAVTSMGGVDNSDNDMRRNSIMAHVANSSTDLFYGFSYGLGNSSGFDSISCNGTKTLSIGELAHEGANGATASGNSGASQLPMVTIFRGHLGMGAFTRTQP